MTKVKREAIEKHLMFHNPLNVSYIRLSVLACAVRGLNRDKNETAEWTRTAKCPIFTLMPDLCTSGVLQLGSGEERVSSTGIIHNNFYQIAF